MRRTLVVLCLAALVCATPFTLHATEPSEGTRLGVLDRMESRLTEVARVVSAALLTAPSWAKARGDMDPDG